MASRHNRGRPRAPRQGPMKDPFERSLEDALGQLYEDVLSEPLPSEIAELADELEKRIRAGESGKGTGSS